MNTKILNRIVGDLDNESLGLMVVSLVTDNVVSPEELGELVRTSLCASPPLVAEAVTDVEPEIPQAATAVNVDASERSYINRFVYSSFDVYRRRSLSALSRSLGLDADSLYYLIKDNTDFVFSGGTSGTKYVSIRGL